MTHQDFINTWNNKKLERVDSTNHAQCFDLAVAYCEDVLGTPRSIMAGLLHAYQIFENPTEATSKNFDFIKNTPYALPKRGDIIVWGRGYGPSGHVAVVDSADINSFRAFSQNDPIGSPCHMKTYSYNHIIGWLRKVTNSVASSELEACLVEHAKAVKSADELKQTLQTKQKEWEATEKRLKQEKDLALADKERELQRVLAEREQFCLQKVDEYRQHVIQKVNKLAQEL